ncbi:hypothetical protein NDA18_004495 [Ustilago nuda]|nr:hypothetical protein NDA18_004495 [Ustilago nuda]
MKELLKKRRRVRLYTLEAGALVQRLPKVDGVEVAKSVGGPLDRDLISIMTYRYSSFFVIGGNGKVRDFDRKPESNSYTWINWSPRFWRRSKLPTVLQSRPFQLWLGKLGLQRMQPSPRVVRLVGS